MAQPQPQIVFCAECEDRDVESCDECPRCCLCAERLSQRPHEAVQVSGHVDYCSPACLGDDLANASGAEPALYTLDLLAALAGEPLLSHSQLPELIGLAEGALRLTLRRFVARPRAAAKAERETASWGAAELSLLAQAERGTLVDRRCPVCARTFERYVDRFGTDKRAEELGLCDWHSHVEALLIQRRQTPARTARTTRSHIRNTGTFLPYPDRD